LRRSIRGTSWQTVVFKEIRDSDNGRKKVNTEDGEEKKKMAPTAYNLFVKERMRFVKEENTQMSRQDLIREVGRMWKEKKGNDKEERGL